MERWLFWSIECPFFFPLTHAYRRLAAATRGLWEDSLFSYIGPPVYRIKFCYIWLKCKYVYVCKLENKFIIKFKNSYKRKMCFITTYLQSSGSEEGFHRIPFKPMALLDSWYSMRLTHSLVEIRAATRGRNVLSDANSVKVKDQ